MFWYCQSMDIAMRSTERNSTDTVGLDTWDDARILTAIVEGQERAIAAVRNVLPQIASAATLVADCLQKGGRLIYAGAGTSIRIGVQDGSELPATFGMPDNKIVYLIAGGPQAIFETFADAEDDAAEGARAAGICTRQDVMIAIAASGSTPYTIAAATKARELGAHVIAVVNNAGSTLAKNADIEIVLDSGPEIIAGSTRMGAGTAQKAALNLLSTLAHIKLGAVHDGMMVNVQSGNVKLKARARKIVARIAGVPEPLAEKALDTAQGHVKPAVLLCAGAKSLVEAQHLLADKNGNLRLALKQLTAL